ncbi:hypothetical protein H104_08721 [Trichophyton rubrum CBS 289.86]|nr:hypothetical protein H104_08721 [Trichophyton rubrum CBS 289.86]KMQ42671.1 hypothetical protein HL42_6646 [Trichophyton rubrum]
MGIESEKSGKNVPSEKTGRLTGSASSSRRSTHQSTLTHPYTLPQVDEGIKDKAWHGMEWVDAASEVKEGYRGSLEANHSQQPAGHIPNPSIELSMEQVKHVHKYRSI